MSDRMELLKKRLADENTRHRKAVEAINKQIEAQRLYDKNQREQRGRSEEIRQKDFYQWAENVDTKNKSTNYILEMLKVKIE